METRYAIILTPSATNHNWYGNQALHACFYPIYTVISINCLDFSREKESTLAHCYLENAPEEIQKVGCFPEKYPVAYNTTGERFSENIAGMLLNYRPCHPGLHLYHCVELRSSWWNTRSHEKQTDILRAFINLRKAVCTRFSDKQTTPNWGRAMN